MLFVQAPANSLPFRRKAQSREGTLLRAWSKLLLELGSPKFRTALFPPCTASERASQVNRQGMPLGFSAATSVELDQGSASGATGGLLPHSFRVQSHAVPRGQKPRTSPREISHPEDFFSLQGSLDVTLTQPGRSGQVSDR